MTNIGYVLFAYVRAFTTIKPDLTLPAQYNFCVVAVWCYAYKIIRQFTQDM